ncbi:MAG TPA: ABC transporter permease, partial [Aggregatilineales bacterium]|nr:ABC transporter permease [Aggregatilineales bacterium]
MNLRKILLIARREYMTNFRRRSFLFTMFFVPLFTIVITVVVVAIAGSAETDMGNVKSIAIVDEAGLLTDSSGNVVVDPPAPFHLIDRATAASKLANNEIQGIYLIGQPYLARGEVNSISRESLPGGVQIALEDYLKAAIAAKAGDPAITARLADPIAKHQIFRTDRPGVPVDEWALIGELLLPFGFGFIVFTATMTTSQFLMSGVAEEKENRMMELLATSVRPGEMLWGKILGLGALGLSQLVIWAAIGLVFAYTRSGIDIGRVLADLSITPTFLALLVSYFILSYLLTGAFMATLGVIGDNEQEGRQLATLI